MSQGRKPETGFTITELMVVVVIIGILAAVATPSFTKDSNARKGREYARMVAQTLQRAHLDAMSSRVVHRAFIYANRVEVYRADASTPIRTLHSPSYADGSTNLAIWDVRSDGAAPTPRVLGTDAFQTHSEIFFNTMGNAGFAASSSSLTNYQIYIRNEALSPKHPDGGFIVTVTGLTSFVSMRNIEFAQ